MERVKGGMDKKKANGEGGIAAVSVQSAECRGRG